VLRLIEEEAGKKKSGEVRAVVSPDMSIFLLNERRPRVNEIEERTGVRIVVVSDPTRSDNRFEVSRLRDDDKKLKDSASYEIQDEVGSSVPASSNPVRKAMQETPAVNIKPPKKPKRKKEGFLKKFINSLTKKEKEEPKAKPGPRRNTRRNNQNKSRQGAPRKNTSNQSRRNPNPRPKTSEQTNAKNKKSENPKKKSGTNKPNPSVNKSDKPKTQNELQTNAKGNQRNTVKNPNEKPKKAEKKEPVEKNGNVITEEKEILEVDGNVMPDKPSKSSNRRNKTTDKTVAQKTVQKDLKSSEDIQNSNTDSKDHSVDTQNSKHERPAKKVESEETAVKDEIVKEVKPKETTVKKKSAKKAKDWGRASNDPRNK
jgi:ribonuclease E